MTVDVFVGPQQTNKSKYNYTADKTVVFQVANGKNTIYAKGTWGGGTLTAYASADGNDTNKFALGLTLNADGYISIPATLGEIKTNGLVLILSDSTNPDLNVWVL